MNTSAHHRAEGLFYEALDRSPEDREAFLAEACGDDAALRTEGEELLRAHEEAGGFLKDETAGPGEPEPSCAETEAELARLQSEEAGERIGPCRLLEQIGEGGFGTVWMAEQETPIRRRVALKIVKLGMDTKDVTLLSGL